MERSSTTTLLLPSRHTDDTQALWRAAIARGWDVERLQGLRVDPTLAARDLVLYVDGLTASAVSEELRVDLMEPPLDFLARLPFQFVSREIRFSTLVEARKETRPAFIKPAADKAFAAKVYASGADLPEWDDMPVLISAPVEWHVEYRFFILDRVPVTGSVYLHEGELTDDVHPFDNEAHAFVTSLCADPTVDLPAATVIDVGVIRDRGWAVVEANPAWASGILRCDPDRVLDVLRRATARL